MERDWDRALVEEVFDVVDRAGRRVDSLDGSAPVTFLVDGPPGIGKSTALTRVAAKARESAVRLCWAKAHELSARTPFGVFSDALGLAVGYPPPADAADRLLAEVDTLCAAGPLVLMVDDVHHADADSMALLLRMNAIGRDLPVVQVLARRRLPSRELLVLLAGQPQTKVFAVPPLTDAESRAITGELLGGAIGPHWDPVLRAAAGNPFHLRELVHRIPRTSSEAGQPAEVQASVRQMVGTQLLYLSRDTRVLIGQLAVWGSSVGPGDIAALNSTSVMSIAAAITEGLDADVLRWATDDLLDFAHDLYRDVAYEQLDDPMRRLMHQSCAQFLTARPGQESAVAYHLERSVSPSSGGGTAVAQQLQAAAAAIGNSPGVAAELLSSAAQLASAGPLAARIALERAQSLLKAGRMAAAAEVAGAALSGATAADPGLAAGLSRVMLLSNSSRARVGDVDDIVQRLGASGRLPPAVLERLRTVQSWVHVLAGDLGPAPTADALREIGPGSVTSALGALPTATLAVRAMLSGNGIEAVRIAELTAEGHHQLADLDTQETSSVDIWPALFRLFTYGSADAAHWAGHWRKRTAQLGDAWVEPFHQYVSAAIALSAGRLDDAAAEFDAGLDSAAESSSGWNSWAVGSRATLDLIRGEPARADRRLRDFERSGLPLNLGIPITDLVAAQLAQALGHRERAVELAAGSWAAAADRGIALWAALSGPRYARLALDLDAHQLARQVRAEVAALDTTLMPALAPAAELTAAIFDRNAAAAVAAGERFAAAGDRFEAALAVAEAALLAADDHDRPAAREYAGRAVAEFADLGAAGSQRSFLAALRARGVALGAAGKRRRPSHGWESLTPTELDVVDMVADGRTGPDIARTLYVSPRTIQTHVSHALQKLGLTSRLELAARVVERRSTTISVI